MNNLKEDIKKIYEFVNCEFNIEDKDQIKAVKESLTLEKIEILDNMLNEYNKQVKSLKRKEQQKKAQERFKKAGVNLKIEEYEIFEYEAKAKNMNMSQFVKSALDSFIKKEKVEMVDKSILEGLNRKYEAIEEENKQIKLAITQEKEKSIKFQKNFEVSEKIKNDYKLKIGKLETSLKTEISKFQKIEDMTVFEIIRYKLFKTK